MEELYEWVMVTTTKIHLAFRKIIKKTWFINRLKKECKKYINILPSDILEKTHFTKK